MSLSIVIPGSSIATRDIPEVIVDTSQTLGERSSIITNVTHTNWTAPNPICLHQCRKHKFVLGWSPAISFCCSLTTCEPPECNNRELIIFFIECSSPQMRFVFFLSSAVMKKKKKNSAWWVDRCVCCSEGFS